MSTFTVRPAVRQVKQTNTANNAGRNAARATTNTSQWGTAAHSTNNHLGGRSQAFQSDYQGTQDDRHREQRQRAIERLQNETDVKAVEKEEERRRKEEEKQAERIRQHERLYGHSEGHVLSSRANPVPAARTVEDVRLARLAKFASNSSNQNRGSSSQS